MVKASPVKAGILAPEREGEFHPLSKNTLNRRTKVPSNFDSRKHRYFLTKYHTIKMMMSIKMSRIAQLRGRKLLKAHPREHEKARSRAAADDNRKATEGPGTAQLPPLLSGLHSLSPPGCLPHCPNTQASLQGGSEDETPGPPGWNMVSPPIGKASLWLRSLPLQSRAIISTQDEGCENEG